MEFINREKELKQLKECYKLSNSKPIALAISGLRRVGKTTLIKKFIKNKKSIYLFVYESKTSLELLREYSEELRRNNLIGELEKIESWAVFFGIIFKRCSNYIIVFDEFQNFYDIDKSIFSILQRNIDESKTPLNIVFLGSLIGLFKNIFEEKKQPLYGRILIKINLKPFSLKDSVYTLKHLKYNNFEDILRIYGLFGGFPKYYASLEQFNLINKNYTEIIDYLFLQDNAPLENEVLNILKQEFGRRSSLYYTILHSIAIGKTKLNEIASITKMKDSSITRHLDELENKFELIKSIKPLNNKKSTRYFVNHPLALFWFRFIYDKFSDYEIKNSKNILTNIKHNFNSFFGRRFEEICKDFILLLNTKNKLPFNIEYLNNWWGSARVFDERKEIEIDLVALNKVSKQSIFIECKWKENVDHSGIINNLKQKSEFFKWNNDKREEFFCVIAKSFKNKTKEKNVLLFDLKDMAKELVFS